MRTLEEVYRDGWLELDGRVFKRTFLGALLSIIGGKYSVCTYCMQINEKELPSIGCVAQEYKNRIADKSSYLCKAEDELWMVDHESGR